jgi:hypothetical protein
MMKHLYFHIAQKETAADGSYTMATVCRTGGGYPLAQGEAQKYMLDIVAHALSFSQAGLEPDALQCADQGYLLTADGDYILVDRKSVKPVGLECADMGNLLAGGDYLLVKT